MCLFCQIAAQKVPANIVHEDDDVIAFHDIHPQAPTHILIIPKKHITSLAHATRDDEAVLGKLMLTAAQIAQTIGLAEKGYRTVINTGQGAGQTVFHIHMHLLGGRRMQWPPG